MTNLRCLPVFLAGLLAVSASPAQTDEFTSNFITYDLSKCLKLNRQSSRTETMCVGDNNIPVWIIKTRADHRTFVGYGNGGRRKMAARQTLPGTFSVQPVIEWRRSRNEGEWQTFAAIQRWLTRDERGIKGETLVITKIDGSESCHIAYLDAVVTPHVHARARFIADLCTPKFDCEAHKPLQIKGPPSDDQQRICSTSWSSFVPPLR